jgi:hypothetical protein
MIRSLIVALAGIVLAATALVARSEEESLQQKYDHKVGEAWFKDNGFTDDYDKARAQAKEQGKPIFAYFTRSYAF